MNCSIHLSFSASQTPQILALAFRKDQWWGENRENLGPKVYRAFQNSVSDFTQKDNNRYTCANSKLLSC